MLKKVAVEIDKVHVPVKRVQTLDPDRVARLAEDMLENGQTTPVRLRSDGARYVLIEGYHRLEALRSLGETTVDTYLVRARQH